ncbi:uncharacterized protein BYT42DRAFT_566102 [Radiomyces spectabilis]|uniref:uncharacterized protein n=1 Tax=Radiomyces spectabilis TaxID=64574 RepID=UPI00221EA1B4|nr:uncharacterized protein BYT42DRAFT_566102 [Radiomyces spectabilis]KAI8381318.1 hypothetical protein BYT42DRAFT_566102 [Radiomyces spectabilis]
MTVDYPSSVSNKAWCLIESDPAIFNAMMQEYGVKNLKVEEVWDLNMLPDTPVHGLIFASKYKEDLLPEHPEEPDEGAEKVIFSCQVVLNVCATLALLGILLNCNDDVDIGNYLRHFKHFTKDFDPCLRGLAVGNSDMLRNTHNTFASNQVRAENALPRMKEAPKKRGRLKKDARQWVNEDMYHFVSYVPIEGYLWELDGMKKYPVRLGPCAADNWLDVAKPLLQKKMIPQNEDESIDFSLMAIVTDSTAKLRQRYEFNSLYISKIDELLDELHPPWRDNTQDNLGKKRTHDEMEYDKDALEDILKEDIRQITVEGLRKRRCTLDEENKVAQAQLRDSELQKEHEEMENARRKADYFPFIKALFKKLDEKNILTKLIQ